MLEKFKLFKDKDKAKLKSSSGKSSSKPGSTGTSSASTSTLSTSSRSDTSSSISARSSSSADAGPSSSATSTTSTNDPDSPKLSKARPIVGGVNSSRRDNLGGLTIGHQQSRQASPSPYSSSLPATPVSSLPVSHSKKGKSQRSSDAQLRMQYQHSGSSTLGKSSKGGSLIPKSGKAQKSSSTLSLTSSSSGSQIPTGSSIPTPSTAIPKPSQSSGKLSKLNKEEKMKGSGSSKDGSSQQVPPGHVQQAHSLTRKSRSHAATIQQQQIQQQQQQIQQQQQQQMSSGKMSSHNTSMNQANQEAHSQSSAPPIPPHRNGSQLSTSNSVDQHPTPKQSSHSHGNKSPDSTSKTRYTEIEYTDGKIERVGDGHFVKPTNQAIVSNQPGNRDLSHPYLITSQSVNVVKPTCTSPHTTAVKSDLNSQTMVSIAHNRSAQPPPLPKTEPPPSTRTTVNNQQNLVQSNNQGRSASQVTNSNDSNKQQQYLTQKETSKSQDSLDVPSHSTSSSSNDSVILNSSAANSPRLGIKLGSQTNRPANNVAIVQPHHGEKKETTFDKEVRTDVINKDDKDNDLKKIKDENAKEERKATFIADSGEALDIKPMEPINRSMHYAQGFMRSPYASPAAKPMPIVSQNQCYAMTGVTPTNRIGINRSLMEANKFYSGSIKRTMSTGSGNVSYDEYSSDYDTYDYISGYMSDGDILKNNKMEDMSSGYMSEGGASLYARRLQQRFREGMQAVKECMQKSNNVGDEDRLVFICVVFVVNKHDRGKM